MSECEAEDGDDCLAGGRARQSPRPIWRQPRPFARTLTLQLPLWFLNLVLDSLRAVEDRLVEALAALENDAPRVAQVAGFDWIVSIPMNAT